MIGNPNEKRINSLNSLNNAKTGTLGLPSQNPLSDSSSDENPQLPKRNPYDLQQEYRTGSNVRSLEEYSRMVTDSQDHLSENTITPTERTNKAKPVPYRENRKEWTQVSKPTPRRQTDHEANASHSPMFKQVSGEISHEASPALNVSANASVQADSQPSETIAIIPPQAQTTESQAPRHSESTFSKSLLAAAENKKTTESVSKDNQEHQSAIDSPINNTSNNTTNPSSSIAAESAAPKYSDGTMPEFYKPNEKKSEKEKSGRQLLPESFTPTMTVIASLAIVLGVFFIFAWMMKRATPRHNGLLPKEVFEKLGSIAFSPKMQMHLLRLGGKLVLVSVTPDGMSPVAEVTDPDEVIHLTGLCKQNDPKSSSTMFRQVLKQYAGENGAQQQKQILSAGYQQQQFTTQQQQYPQQNVQQTVRRSVGVVAPAKAYQK
ncbi:MAG: flagellar biosynthetic protein FliO [Planctomycetaceae bacterium]|nr:flagellar biosynthetic protein FliO [Planctomycetaceae bacterium]